MPRETITTPTVDIRSPWDRRLAAWLSIVIFGVMAGVPLVILPGFSFYFDITPKVVILLVGTAAVLPLWGAWAPGLARLLQDGRGRWFVALLAAQMFSLAVSTVFSAQPELSFAGSNWRRLGLVTHGSLLVFTLVLAGWLVSGPNQIVRLLRVITAGGAVAAAYGALQYFGVEWFLPAEAYHVGEADWAIVRPPSTLGQAGYFATYLLHIVFIALCVGKTDPRGGWRKFGLAVAALSSVTVILSGTRAAILGLVIGAALLWFWYRPRLSRRLAVGTVAVVAAGVVFYLSPLGQKLRSRTDWYLDDVGGGARLWLWSDSLRMGVSHWATGTGLETFSSEYPRYQSIGLAQAFPNRYHESPHNMFLDAFTGQGMWGLAVLASLAAVGVFSAWRAKQRDFSVSGYLAGSLVAGIWANQFLAFTVPTALYFYAGAALLVAMMNPRSRLQGKSMPVWGWLVTVPMAFAFVLFAWQLGTADRKLSRLNRAFHAGNVEETIRLYNEFLEIKPLGMNADLWFARGTLALLERRWGGESRAAAWAAGLDAARRATEGADDRHNAFYNLASFHAIRNDFRETENSLRAAILIAPNWYKPHWKLAQIYLAAGLIDKALPEAEAAAELNSGRDPEVAATLNQVRSGIPQ